MVNYMKKRKGLKIFLIIFGIIFLMGGCAVIWQWDNIQAVVYFMKYSKEDLETMAVENQTLMDEAVSTLEMIPRELTEEENKALESGVITEQDAVEISLGVTTLPEKVEEKKNLPESAAKPAATPTEAPKPQKVDRVSELVAQMYVLKSSFISKLDALAAQAIAEYSATPAAQRTSSWKTSKMTKFTSMASVLEAECDAQVEGIITELRAELKKNGGDMSLINTIRSTYDSEKQIKKAYYLNKYLK